MAKTALELKQAEVERAKQTAAKPKAAEAEQTTARAKTEFEKNLSSIKTPREKILEVNIHQAVSKILTTYPDLVYSYVTKRIQDPTAAMEDIIQSAYQKELATGDNSNAVYYQTLLNEIEEQKIQESIKKKADELETETDDKYTPEERKKIIEEMFGNKKDYPAPDMSHLTFQGKPIWYNNVLKNIAARTAQLTSPEKPYPYYLKPRIAKQSREEKIAYDLLTNNLLNPEYRETTKRTIEDLEKLKQESPTQNLSDADKWATERTTNENIEQYVNPKTNSVLDLIQKRALRNFEENIMPKVSAPFIARGSFSTGARTEAQARARRDLMENIMDQETQFLANAYDKARNTASEDKRTYLNYKLSKAGIENEEILKKGKIAEDINKLMDTEHKNKLLDMEALRTIGANQRDVKQKELDLQYEEFKNQVDHPLRQVTILNNMIHQLPVESITGQSSRLVPNVPTKTEQVSPWQTGAGILGQMAAMNMMNKAEGGIIQNHANGNMVDKMKDQYLEDLMARAQNSQSRAQNPWAHYMLGISNSLASSKNPNVVSAIGEGSAHGANQFMNVVQHNKALEDQNLEFKKSIIDYLDQAEAKKQEKIMNELKMQEILASLNPEKIDDIQEKHIPSLTPSNQIPVVTYKNGKVARVRLVDPSGFAGTNNIAPQDISQSQEGFDLSDSNKNNEFDPSKTPTKEDLHNINMRPKLPTNAAEKEAYTQDLKKLEEDKEAAEKARTTEGKILTLKSQLQNLPTGITSDIVKRIDDLSYAAGLGEGKKSKAYAAFQELQLEGLKDISEIFKPMSDTDVEKGLEMMNNPSNTMNSIKERLDLSLAAAKIKQTKAEAKEIWLSKYGSTRGFDARFNSWLKNTEIFGDEKKKGKVIRRKFNENSLDSWPEMFNEKVLKKKQIENKVDNLFAKEEE